MRAMLSRVRPLLLSAAVVMGIGLNGCGDKKSAPPATYVTDFDPPPSLSGKDATLRHARAIRINVRDGTCFPSDRHFHDAARRFDHVEVSETNYALVVKVYMRPEPDPPPQQDGARVCAGVGLEFSQVVHLAHPLGKRALVDGGFDYGSHAGTIRVNASDKYLERLAEAKYGIPY